MSHLKALIMSKYFLFTVLSIVSGILLLLADFPAPVMPLMFISVAPLLYVVYKSKPWQAFLFTMLSWVIGTSWLWHGTEAVLPLSTVIPFVAVFSLLYGLVSALTAWLKPKISTWLWMLIFPAGCVLVEECSILIGLGFWGNTVSGPLSGITWLRATSSFGGAFFVTFVARLVSSCIAVIFAVNDRKKILSPVVITSIIVLFTIIYGSYYSWGPLNNSQTRGYGGRVAPAYDRTVTVAALSIEPPYDVAKLWGGFSSGNQKGSEEAPHEYTTDMLEKYEVLIRRAAADGAKIVATSEVSIFVPTSVLDEFSSWCGGLSKELNITLIVGYFENKTPSNSVKVATPDGKVVQISKHHLVWGTETYRVKGADEPVIIDTGDAKISVKICYDQDFPWAFRRMAQKGADLVVIPAADWWGAAVLHQYQGIYRGVENGMALLRPARWGISSIVDPYGNVLAIGTPDKSQTVYLLATVPLNKNSGTVYTYLGDWVVYLSIFVIIGAVIVGLINGRRKN